MESTHTQRHDKHGLPHISPHRRYNTEEAAVLLSQTPTLLRQWRMRKQGPRYMQAPISGSKVQYLGQWLIEFREASIVEPAK